MTRKVKYQLLKYGYNLEEIEDVQPFDFDVEYKDNLNYLAKIAEETRTLQWGTFYTFDE